MRTSGVRKGLLYVGARPGVDQLRLMIVTSQEYFVRNGGTNTGFLNALYRDVFGRTIDAAGALAFGNALATGTSRAFVARVILQSEEAAQVYVRGLYRRFLDREADAAGLASFTNALLQGVREEDIILSFVTSQEYRNRR